MFVPLLCVVPATIAQPSSLFFLFQSTPILLLQTCCWLIDLSCEHFNSVAHACAILKHIQQAHTYWNLSLKDCDGNYYLPILRVWGWSKCLLGWQQSEIFYFWTWTRRPQFYPIWPVLKYFFPREG